MPPSSTRYVDNMNIFERNVCTVCGWIEYTRRRPPNATFPIKGYNETFGGFVCLNIFSHYMHFALNIALSSSFPAHSLCLVFSLHFNINAAYSSAMFTFQLFFIFFKLSNLFSFNFLYPFLLFSFGLSLYFCGNALFAHFIPLQLHFWLPFFSIWSKFFLAKHWFRRRWTRALTSNQ